MAKEGTRPQNPVNPVHPVEKEYVKNFAVLMGSLPLNPCLRKTIMNAICGELLWFL